MYILCTQPKHYFLYDKSSVPIIKVYTYIMQCREYSSHSLNQSPTGFYSELSCIIPKAKFDSRVGHESLLCTNAKFKVISKDRGHLCHATFSDSRYSDMIKKKKNN